jgi:hypothetical protein
VACVHGSYPVAEYVPAVHRVPTARAEPEVVEVTPSRATTNAIVIFKDFTMFLPIDQLFAVVYRCYTSNAYAEGKSLCE